MLALRASSSLPSLQMLVESCEKLPCAAILLSPSAMKGRTEMELKFCFYLARSAFLGKKNVSKKISNEALLFLARETNFASALRKAGARGTSDFAIVCEKSISIPLVRKRLCLSSAKRIALPKSGRKRGKYTEGELAVEEMALARVKN